MYPVPKVRVVSFSNFGNALAHLELAAVDDGGLGLCGDGTGAAASLLNGHDGLHGLLISNLTEDDVLAIEPRGLLGCDEELRAVAVIERMLVTPFKSFLSGVAYVLGPALAMERIPGPVWTRLKFSSANLSP